VPHHHQMCAAAKGSGCAEGSDVLVRHLIPDGTAVAWEVACARLATALLREIWDVASSIDVGSWGPAACQAEAVRQLEHAIASDILAVTSSWAGREPDGEGSAEIRSGSI
jgi:hypothetical protein